MSRDNSPENPILNSPFREPSRHWELTVDGALTQVINPGRRRSAYFVPIAPTTRKKAAEQVEFELDAKDEEGRAFTPNDLVNEIRGHVERWRRLPRTQWGVTHETARLLDHWRSGGPQPKPFFCQIEAAETVIWFEEVAAKQPQYQALRKKLQDENASSNPGLYRIAAKMATGSGKTTVMAMLIAWQAVNAARGRRSFSDGFLIVCPGITIRDRLRVLLPSDPENYYETRAIAPDDMVADIRKAEIVITNFHAFKLRETLAIPKYARDVLQGRGEPVVTIETEGQMLRRVCPKLLAKKNVVVLNDEAHHCYELKPGKSEEKVSADEKGEANENSKAARLWINGLRALKRKVGLRAIVDVSATPFFLRGSGYTEGTLFPWVVSDFALMDAIECGIGKIPRVPVSDNSLGLPMPVWRRLWPEIREDMPREGRQTKKQKGQKLDPEALPEKLLGAIHALYEHYERVQAEWQPTFGAVGLTVPPVFIVVCQNTSHSKLVYDYIAGYTRTERAETGEERDVVVNGRLPLFRNYDDDRKPLSRPRTLLIDSNELDSGEGLSADFKKIAASEIDAFKAEIAQRLGEGARENVTDEDVLREVMNTVGKPGRLGEQVRCVVSVSMLTEGWDANTVTHILGVRAFGTELLCEQVVGRGLRRISYDPDENGMFSPEYANVFGIPFAFADRKEGPTTFVPPKPTRHVHAMPERADLEIRFPRVQGYRIRLPKEPFPWAWDTDSRFTLSPDVTPTRAKVEDVLGHGETITLDNYMDQRLTTVAFHIAGHALRTRFRDDDENLRPWLFPRLLRATREWLDAQLTCVGGTRPGLFLWKGLADEAALRIYNAHVRGWQTTKVDDGNAGELLPIIDPYNPVGSSRFIDFRTSKPVWETAPDLCHVNFVVGDSDWELAFCETLESLRGIVLAYVKNHGLNFEVPYAAAGSEKRYRPDYVVRLDDGGDDLLNLVVEIKGERDILDQNKKEAMETHWIPAVNADGGFGRWSFVEIGNPYEAEERLRSFLVRSIAA
jgi:type III restriction enzyme